MSRLTIAIDRLVAFLLGLLLVAAGAAAAVWGTDAYAPLSGAIDLGPLSDATDKTWWPWAVGGGGAVLVLLGLRWLASHLPRRGTGPVRLSGTGESGRLEADGSSVASAAADELAEVAGVRSAHGRLLRERGQVVARLDGTLDLDADLAHVAERADEISAQLRHMLGRDDLTCRVQLRIASRNRPTARVH